MFIQNRKNDKYREVKRSIIQNTRIDDPKLKEYKNELIYKLTGRRVKDPKENWKVLSTTVKKNTNRYKWQDLCGLFDNQGISELREIAKRSRIDHSDIYSKRELCKILAKALERKIRLKQRVIESGKCVNTTSLLMTEIKDIPPEFFYTYIHRFPDRVDENGVKTKVEQLFCDDIRDLYKSVNMTNGKHPMYPREKLDNNTLYNIRETYESIEKDANTMKDLDEPIEVENPKLILSRKLGDLASNLPYPPNMDLIANADQEKTRDFVKKLVEVGVLNLNQTNNLWTQQPLSAKVALVELLINKSTQDTAAYEIVDAMVEVL